MKIAAMSDSHGLLPSIQEADILCIAGDISPLAIQRSIQMDDWLKNSFLPWCRELPVKQILLVPGNHDFALTDRRIFDSFLQESDNIKLLIDELYTFAGKIFYGTPWCEGPKNWAFVPEDTYKYYINIPKCDVLIAHQPPDIKKVGCSYPNSSLEQNFGSKNLIDQIFDQEIKNTICGHIHTGKNYHFQDYNFYNVSLLDEHYKPYKDVTYFEI